jgi:hypothetical protein
MFVGSGKVSPVASRRSHGAQLRLQHPRRLFDHVAHNGKLRVNP